MSKSNLTLRSSFFLFSKKFGVAAIFFIFTFVVTACGKTEYDRSLPASATLIAPSGYKIARSIIHLHTPYSYDACDKKGLDESGKPDAGCLADLRNAVCENRIDVAYLSDHVSFFANYSLSELMLTSGTDTPLPDATNPDANLMGGCENGQRTMLLAGFEGKALGLGLQSHASPDIATRSELYGRLDATLKPALSAVGAFTGIPHTESKTLAEILDVAPDVFELYNLHANLDPKIRKAWLDAPPFAHFPSVLTYLVDPFQDLNPDFVFLGFFQTFPIYFERWTQMLQSGLKSTAVGGSDSHQNVFPQTAGDGQRLDSHRRLLRFFSNHLYVTDYSRAGYQDALRNGRVLLVAEGFGTPVGFDFAAADSGSIRHEIGGTLGSSNHIILKGKIPTIHPSSFKGAKAPLIHAEIYRVPPSGPAQKVFETKEAEFQYKVPAGAGGAYRIEIRITPFHLAEMVGEFPEVVEKEFPWILSNPIYLP